MEQFRKQTKFLTEMWTNILLISY